jgi:hypothetical protein
VSGCQGSFCEGRSSGSVSGCHPGTPVVWAGAGGLQGEASARRGAARGWRLPLQGLAPSWAAVVLAPVARRAQISHSGSLSLAHAIGHLAVSAAPLLVPVARDSQLRLLAGAPLPVRGDGSGHQTFSIGDPLTTRVLDAGSFIAAVLARRRRRAWPRPCRRLQRQAVLSAKSRCPAPISVAAMVLAMVLMSASAAMRPSSRSVVR